MRNAPNMYIPSVRARLLNLAELKNLSRSDDSVQAVSDTQDRPQRTQPPASAHAWNAQSAKPSFRPSGTPRNSWGDLCSGVVKETKTLPGPTPPNSATIEDS